MGLTYTPGSGWNLNYDAVQSLINLDPYRQKSFMFRIVKDGDWKGNWIITIPSYKLDASGNRTYYSDSELQQRAIDHVRSLGVNKSQNWEAKHVQYLESAPASSLNSLGTTYFQKEAENNTITASNNIATTNNAAYDKVLQVATSTRGGDYTTQREIVRSLGNINPELKSALENSFKTFYLTEKLQQWDTALGAQPPYGAFDPNYYKTQNPGVQQAWQAAVNNDDLDITARYGENGYYLQHYTSQGRPAGLRGNAAETTVAAQNYVENKPTDADLQALRTLQLGINTESISQRLLAVPEVSAEWEKAKSGDAYWASLGKQYYLDTNKPDEFAALFRLSNREQDKQVSFNYNLNTGAGVTELEDALNTAVGEKALIDTKKFGALTQNVLKDTIEEMKKAKANEQFLSFMSGFGGFQEIVDINKTLTDSILGDSGVGGVLSFVSGDQGESSLEKSLQNITGIRNSATYNWQQWFDTALKNKYDKEIELGYTKEEAQQTIKIEAQFARDFIDKYLIPRFNTARSMNEFVEYLDVRQSEKNPFQTQDLLDATSLVADLRARQYIDQIKATNPRYFNSDFYFNPSGDRAREDRYLSQTAEVNADWEAAKRGDPYWAQQAYRFGIDVNNKDSFARMHFQVKGQGKGYDAADDILNASKVSSQIYDVILPALKEEVLKQGTIFGQFIKPEEFADEMLKGLDPNNKGTWQEVLDQYGLSEFKGDINGLRTYVIEALQTGSAQQIREQIKYLNEKRKRPTQELLGITYIERAEDYTGTAKAETELYKTFQSAGYKGTEDEFYENFFPDLDRSEMSALTKAGTGETFELTGLNFNTTDPFEAMGNIERFFPDDEGETVNSSTGSSSDFFSLRLDDDEEGYTKSKAGSDFLGEFTSMFKGL
jgi:hypothetical protein